mmetsp:Transcript_91264/g.254899  ORF Transcript_91264/g.254899 Transcript_91264/m.254899 type:complete len:255 (+) Transcript_91264:788-1552(+)
MPMEPSQGTETVNVEPTPSSDLTRKSPPSNSQISEQTAKPKPMPWKVFVSWWLSCSNGWKIRFCPSGVMPLPVSVTLTSRSWASSLNSAVMVTEPFAVNLQAFVTRLYSSWVHLCGQPGTSGSALSAHLLINSTVGFTNGLFALSTAIFDIVVTSWAMAPKSTGSCGRASFLPSARRFSCCASSMMFVTRSSNLAAQPFTIVSCRFFWNFSLLSMDSVKPRMPCRGLRISCDIMASSADFFSCTLFSSESSEMS